ncbi:MAG: DNA polymerase III subunit gamma/tau [Actinomycetota bacterium]|nr:DNA polymerase III subunit gamma/tau [Actinomycetota bacterium]
MEHISLYRKWRPKDFSELVGQKHITNTLASALESRKIVHAYLFAGPRGTGKTSTARILAKAINCYEGPTATPCNKCDACVSISEGTALDVIEIDAASNRKIDEIRGLLEKIPFSPTALRSKVYIIDEVHQLTAEASSALLKTLEEPPAHVIFVLATTEPQKLLPTIVSRCQRYDFKLVPAREIDKVLRSISRSEGIEIEDEAVTVIAEHARGSVRDAIGVIDQVSGFQRERITSAQIAELLGAVESGVLFKMIDLIVERDTPGVLALIGEVVESGRDPSRFAESLISHLRSLFLVQNAYNPREIVSATDEHFERLAEQASRLKTYEVLRLIERFGEASREMRSSEYPRLILECAAVKAVRVDADVTLEGLIYRIDELERRITPLLKGGGSPRAGTEEISGEPAGRKGREKENARGLLAGTPVGGEPGSGDLGERESQEKAEVRRKPGGPREKGREVGSVSEGETAGDYSIEASISGDELTRDEARRAWSAVLAELKRAGKIRLYALLARARVEDVNAGKVLIVFSQGASFNLEVLKDSLEVSEVEKIFSKVIGRKVSIELNTRGGSKKAGRGLMKDAPFVRRGDSGGAPDDSGGEQKPESQLNEVEGKQEPKGLDAGGIVNYIEKTFDGSTLEE